ncbi:MAG: hypothetical protein RL238_3155 [Actinomycetota bacterium]
MHRPGRPFLAALLALGALAACASEPGSTAPSVGETTTSVASTSTTVAPTTVPPTTAAPTTTTAAPPTDPDAADIPDGECATIAEGAVGFRNDTDARADEYRSIGVSTEGRTIWSEHWGSTSGPQVLVVGQVHGDECAPAFFVREIRLHPPTEFGIWLIPTLNPDGLAAHTRRTALDLDPNRDGFNLATPEANTLMDATLRIQPVLTVHLHSPYRWVGAHNGPLATKVAVAMSTAVGWGYPYNAGRVQNGTLAFLWEGQELVIPGHQSVLVEFPAMAPAESPNPPDLTQRRETSVPDVRWIARQMRVALYEVFDELARGSTDG